MTEVDRTAIEQVAFQAESLAEKGAVTRRVRLDMYLFWSFDLVGSTAIKNREQLSFSWIGLIRDFYTRCASILVRLGVHQACVWKYVGDEVLFYRRMESADSIGRTLGAIYRCLDGYLKELEQTEYADALRDISIKAMAWAAPIASYENANGHDRFTDLILSANPADQRIEEPISAEGGSKQPALIDFLEPNIDAGFRLGIFARKKQLVVSPGLASYLIVSQFGEVRFRIVGFEKLKGVAREALYPGLWYRENWATVCEDFTYQERLSDPHVRTMCKGSHEELNVLAEVRGHVGHPYFWDRAQIDEIMRRGSTASL